MSFRIARIDVAGFKSIRKMDQPLELGPLNILIGANGSGKTNLLTFFRLVQALATESLQLYVAKHGYALAILHGGPKHTSSLSCTLEFDSGTSSARGYGFVLEHAFGDTLTCTDEFELQLDETMNQLHRVRLGPVGQKEPIIGHDLLQSHPIAKSAMRWKVHHFNDTSATSRIRGHCQIQDNRSLQSDGSNLAAILYALRHSRENDYVRIRDTVRLVAPYFSDFDLEPDPHNRSLIHLAWREPDLEPLMTVGQLSDGTLRFMCLATLLRQTELPDLIIIDEPELGLHPAAIEVLAGLLRSASTRTQIIVSTQSVTLVDQFEPEDVIVVDRQDGQSVFRRLDTESLKGWLEDYSLGELWLKNVVGGRPWS